ncbi:hypothetical protein MTR67_007617 [Solanum verrucosum]|uniref:Reverse transcriptase zinc-binding domain-containing protein n=1 Tax=Solanum verrucosum TaxID=315347 RepID=A0AAF0Q043_SOLVR|nr:hypothetical protein MTR67_007617 [Solanum verrucosum]
MIWKAKIPYKVSCFTWLLAKQAVLTQENLMKRGIQLSPRCFLCGEKAETVTHLFLHCRITNQLWDLFINKKELKWVMPRRVTQTLPASQDIGRDGKSSQLVFGGQRGKKGTLDVIRTRATLFRR